MPVSTRPVRPLLVRRLPGIGLATLLLAGHQGGEAAVSVIVGATIQRAVDGGSVLALIGWLIALGLDFATLSLCYRFGSRLSNRLGLGIEHDLRMRVVRSTIDLPHPRDGTVAPAEAVAIATSDARRIGSSLRGVISVVVAAVTIAVVALVLIRSSVVVAALVFGSAIVVLLLLTLLGGPLERRSETEQGEVARTAALATDFAAGMRVLAGLGAGPAAAERYRLRSQQALTHTIRASLFEGGLTASTSLVVGLYLAAVGLVAGRLALAGQLGVGDLIAALGLAQFVLGPMQTLGSAGAALARGRASAARIAGVLAGDVPVSAGAPHRGVDPTPLSAPAITLDLVTSDPLAALSLRAEGGALTGLAVPDPAEAAALVALLAAETKPLSGIVACGDLTTEGTDPSLWRRTVLVSPHETAVFGRSLAAALRSRGRLPDEDVLEAAGLRDVISREPDGLASPLGDEGLTLSGGERQRLAVARALGFDAPVLVLHEPTTAVDSATEAAIATGIRRIRDSRTTILVTTSPALLLVCDEVIVVRNGRATQRGSHDALARLDEAYREAVLS
ncbi:MAG: lipid transporter ATPase/inner rane protein [Frondihabitans sp.]|nr:lipid transporter ATPase/inner rane protein [Frondihabitans sp.]